MGEACEVRSMMGTMRDRRGEDSMVGTMRVQKGEERMMRMMRTMSDRMGTAERGGEVGEVQMMGTRMGIRMGARERRGEVGMMITMNDSLGPADRMDIGEGRGEDDDR